MASSRTRTKGRPDARQARDAGQRPPFLRRRSTQLLGAALAAVLVAGVAGIRYISRGAEVLTADKAVEDFRSQAAERPAAKAAPKAGKERPAAETKSAGAARAEKAADPGAAQPRPEDGYAPIVEGVYTFATEGYEETDALTGQRHDYPSETAMTVRNGGCGWISRWQPLEERWEETEACEKPGATSMGRYTMYHEFFQRGVRDDFSCPGSVIQKPKVTPGETWTFTCRGEGTKASADVTVVAIEDVNVGGQVVRAQRYRYDIKATGANEGTIIQERWLSTSPRAMVRMTQKADLKVDSPFGKVNYKEQFRIDLKSLQPRR